MSLNINENPTLMSHFEPRLLSEILVSARKLNFLVRYEPTFLPKTGLQAILAKTPFGTDEPVAMDIDVSCGLYDTQGALLEVVWYGNLRDSHNLVRHNGDTFIGMNKAYRPNIVQESLSVRLAELPDAVAQVVFFVHSHHQQALRLAKFGECILADDENYPIHELPFASLDESVAGLGVWQLTRVADDWQMSFVMRAIKADDAGEIAKTWQN